MKLLLVLCFTFFYLSQFTNNQVDGTYEGILMGKKVIGVLKYQNDMLTGSIYENRYNKHTLIGIKNKNSFAGQINLSNLGLRQFTGVFHGDTLQLEIALETKKILPILIKKNNSTNLNIEKVFGAEKIDEDLIGTWKLLSSSGASGIQKNGIDDMILYKGGTAQYTGYEVKSEHKEYMNQIKMTWFTTNKQLRILTQIKDHSSLFNQGSYTIKNDSLICKNEENNMTTIFLRKK